MNRRTPSKLILLAMIAGACSLSPQLASAAKYKVISTFMKKGKTGTSVGGPGGLIMDSAGNLFGVTQLGPHHGLGAVYELLRNKKYAFRLLHGFCKDCSEGAYPNSPLIMDVQGNLYGTTSQAGANNAGTAFRVSPDGTFTLLYTFCSEEQCTDGTGPSSGLTYAGESSGALYDGVSPLYGVTEGGGIGHVAGGPGGGVLYQLMQSQQGWTESVLYNFCSAGGQKCSDGSFPGQGLLVDAGGNLFGVTADGGNHPYGKQASGAGVAYELIQSGGAWAQKVIYSFCSQRKCADGNGPTSPLLEDAEGNFYGTTAGGGGKCNNAALSGQRCGVLYEISPSGSDWQETVLYDFCRKADCQDGLGPLGPLLMDSAGTLFGTTYEGGGNDAEPGGAGGGTVYQFAGGVEKVLHAFCAEGGSDCTDGYSPRTGVIMDSAGFLYGTAFDGGVFRLTP